MTHRNPADSTFREPLLSDALLESIRERAPHYDRDNRFFFEDFQALQQHGYLAAPVPQELGGSGASLSELIVAQRRLAAHAPATALGINMHLVWVQVAQFLRDRGDLRLEWILRDAAQGEVFAFGISEAGNDAVLLDAKSTATAQSDGSYLMTGTKIFTTLSPIWTRLGVHARVVDEHEHEHEHEIVFGFVNRASQGTTLRDPATAHHGLDTGHLSHPGVWNPLGMRATQSYVTQLDAVRIRPEAVAARFPAYDGRDPLVLAIFSSFSLLTAAVYAGIADRALELATTAANATVTPMRGELTTKLSDPDVAARLTAAALAHRQSLNTLGLLARDIDAQTPREDWFVALAAARNQVTDEAQATVMMAMRVVGASGYQAESELARLSRDVLAGLYHPSSAAALARSVRASLAEG